MPNTTSKAVKIRGREGIASCQPLNPSLPQRFIPPPGFDTFHVCSVKFVDMSVRSIYARLNAVAAAAEVI